MFPLQYDYQDLFEENHMLFALIWQNYASLLGKVMLLFSIFYS